MSSSSSEECRSPVGLDCCSCCLDLANRSGLEESPLGCNNNPGSPGASPFQQLREQLVCENLNADKLSRIMRQDSLEPVLRDPCYLLNQGICNRNIDQTLLSILLFFHRKKMKAVSQDAEFCSQLVSIISTARLQNTCQFEPDCGPNL